jgi:hypothetical protein
MLATPSAPTLQTRQVLKDNRSKAVRWATTGE